MNIALSVFDTIKLNNSESEPFSITVCGDWAYFFQGRKFCGCI